MVNCERCAGFLVRDSIYNLGGQFLELEVARCINCGHTVDLTVLKTRHEKKKEDEVKKEKAVA